MTDRPPRRSIPLAVQLEVAKRQLAAFLGCQPNELDLDHTPALGLRPVNDDGTDYVPAQNDPNHLEWLAKPVHLLKTNGRRGESDLSISSNSDKARIAKAKRLEDARRALLSKQHLDTAIVEIGEIVERNKRKIHGKSQWPQGRKLQSRNTLRRKDRDGR